MARLRLFVCVLAASLAVLQAAPPADDIPTSSSTATPSTPPTIPPSTSSTTIATSTTVDPACLPQCPRRKNILEPNPCDCQRYWRCHKDAAAATADICLPWENFDSKKLECVFWADADCSAVVTDGPPGGSSTEAPVVPGCSFEPSCPAQGSANLGVPCPDSCKIYVACKDGLWTRKDCPFYKPWFDVKSNKCVLFGGKCAEAQ